MGFFRPARSISSRLTRMNLLVSGAALLLACIAFFSYDLISFQQSLIHLLAAEARITGLNSVSALVFNDRDAARATLVDLASSPDVMGAAIVTNDGKVFAEYRRPGTPAMEFLPLPPDKGEHSWTSGRHVLLASRIVFQGRSEGIVYISAELEELGHRARQYVLIAIAILILCLIAANLIGASFRRMVAEPIVSLAEMSRAVSRDPSYSLRAPLGRAPDEIAVLIESFNEMLAQIEHRDAALRHARDELEQRVEERTAELKSANRELEAFSYTVAHDLRGPLDVIGSLSYLLRRKYGEGLDPEGREMLDQLRQTSTRMTSLIDDLLHLSRAGTSGIERSTVDLSQIALEISLELRIAEPERNVEFVIAPRAIALADAGLIRVVLENLLRNAWKYSSNRAVARIEFGFRRSGGHVTYFVRDNGAGFNPELAERLFKPFERLHTQAEFAGTGIGLATVQRVIARHGGTVWAEGAVDGGATFYFSLEE